MGEVSIVRARPLDAQALFVFAGRLFRETYSADLPASDLEEYVSKNFGVNQQLAEILDLAGAVFIAVGDDGIAGYAHLAGDNVSTDQNLLLKRLYVDASWRGLGLAGRLLEEVLEECRKREVSRLRLTVYEKNERAIAFYKRSGFNVSGAATFNVGNEVQQDLELTMSVPLTRGASQPQ